MVEYLRMQASRCQHLSRTSHDLASAAAFRVMADEHLRRAKLEEDRLERRVHVQQQAS
jgi:hypothetical protein